MPTPKIFGRSPKQEIQDQILGKGWLFVFGPEALYGPPCWKICLHSEQARVNYSGRCLHVVHRRFDEPLEFTVEKTILQSLQDFYKPFEFVADLPLPGQQKSALQRITEAQDVFSDPSPSGENSE